jgi:predicted nucleic acid-binding protein
MGLAEALRGRRAYFDTNVFIYAVEGYPAYTPLLNVVYGLLESGELHAVTSEITLAEVLVKPLMDGNRALVQRYQEALDTSQGLTVVPISRSILLQAARVRAQAASIPLPDAIHVATAQATGCPVLLTNDTRLKAAPGLQVILLSEIPAP